MEQESTPEELTEVHRRAGRREEGERKKKLLPQKLMLLVSAGVHSHQPCEDQAGWTGWSGGQQQQQQRQQRQHDSSKALTTCSRMSGQ